MPQEEGWLEKGVGAGREKRGKLCLERIRRLEVPACTLRQVGERLVTPLRAQMKEQGN
jgi:MarR-like DNA-binding transcriptional regulator SgrR of sgrS sRNA